jgi:NADPH-dependent 2,4-dienoyl-CoA reductase/sulfur reductase-like enzyme
MAGRTSGPARYCVRPECKCARMNSATKHFDVVVVGGGPAGLAAATSAAERGVCVALVDDNPALGGQIWRGETAHSDPEAAGWIKRLGLSGVERFCGMRVVDKAGANVLRVEASDSFCDLSYRNLVLATGARERFLPFPGWTLPNVMGAGALQAMVKAGLPIEGKRVVVAGTGPLLLAVAAYLRKHGADIAAICEQASLAALARFGLTLLRTNKVSQAFSLRRELSGTRFLTTCWPIAAEGEESLKTVTIRNNRKPERIACDYLACGFHLVPNTELAALLGCRLENGFVAINDLQRTSVPAIFCAGEPTGIGGVELSLVEGEIAGLVSAGHEKAAMKLFSRRTYLRKFTSALDKTFALRAELKQLPQQETIVCRCEDVTCATLKRFDSWRFAKLQTRCGMGPCQGRVCGPAVQFLLGWNMHSVRPPLFPTILENLAAIPGKPGVELSGATRGTQ